MLEEIRESVRRRVIRMYRDANAGHVGCSLSCLDMMVYTRFELMGADDRMVLSKGHAAALLYSVLAEAGKLTEEDIASFYKNGTSLPAHPPVNKLRDVPFATGSLGHGLSLAAGLGVAARLKKAPQKTFCITSDGELNEGSTWEAALFIAHHNLTNVVWLIDRNYLQGFGRTEDTMKLDPLDRKLESFGFEVALADGHDYDSLRKSIGAYTGAKPLAVICNTVKGRGMSNENTVDCHYLPMSEDEYNKLMTG